jgi:DNA polymerase-3 subunit alpha
MASVLSNNMSDIKQVSFFMEECKRMGVEVLGPDVNESSYLFTVNKAGAIRFGLGAIKGLGSAPVDAIISERKENGNYNTIFDFSKRVNLRVCTKRAFESLAYAGGFDSFKNVHRAQYFKEDGSAKTFLDNAMRFGANFQENANSSQTTIFGDASGIEMPEPEIPRAEEWPSMYKLNKEKEVVGIFISGHPLDDFRLEIESFCKGNIGMLASPIEHHGKDVLIAAVVTDSEERMTKNNDPFGTMTIEDYSDSFKLFLFKDNFLKFGQYMKKGTFIAVRGKFEIPKYRKEPEFVVHAIERLHDLKEIKAKTLNINISNKNLSPMLIADLSNIFMANAGRCELQFTIFDPLDEEMKIVMPSKNIKIDPNNDLIKELKKFDIDFKLLS